MSDTVQDYRRQAELRLTRYRTAVFNLITYRHTVNMDATNATITDMNHMLGELDKEVYESKKSYDKAVERYSDARLVQYKEAKSC